jgi:Mg2+/citrate symporter
MQIFWHNLYIVLHIILTLICRKKYSQLEFSVGVKIGLVLSVLKKFTTEISNTDTLGSLCPSHFFSANCYHKILK